MREGGREIAVTTTLRTTGTRQGRQMNGCGKAIERLWMFFFFQAEDGIRGVAVTGVQTCALPISVHLAEPAGSVRVANEVIASITAMAAREVDGVAALDEASARHFGDWVRRET